MFAKFLSHPELIKNSDKIAVIPTGSFEQQGPFLPMGTDSMTAEAVVLELEKQRPEKVLVYPNFFFGSSKEHWQFSGTVFFDYQTHLKMWGEMIKTILDAGFKNLIIVNGHGGNNVHSISLACANWNYENEAQKVHLHNIYSKGVSDLEQSLFGTTGHHANSCETSLIYYLFPDLKKTNETKITNETFLIPPEKSQYVYPFKTLSPTGVLLKTNTLEIDPEKGKQIFEAMVSELVEFVDNLQN